MPLSVPAWNDPQCSHSAAGVDRGHRHEVRLTRLCAIDAEGIRFAVIRPAGSCCVHAGRAERDASVPQDPGLALNTGEATATLVDRQVIAATGGQRPQDVLTGAD